MNRDNVIQYLIMIALREGWTYVVPGGSLQGYHLSCKRAEKIPQHHTITQHGLRNALLTKGKTHEAKVMEAAMQASHPHCSHTIITPQRCQQTRTSAWHSLGFLLAQRPMSPLKVCLLILQPWESKLGSQEIDLWGPDRLDWSISCF